MNNEEKFKEDLRKLVESKEFSFEESDWEKASELLHPERSRRRAFYYIAAGLILLVSGIGSWFYFTDAAAPAAAHMAETTTASTSEKITAKPSVNKTLSHTMTHAAKLQDEPASQPKHLAGSPTAASTSEKTAPQKEYEPATKQKEIPAKIPVAARSEKNTGSLKTPETVLNNDPVAVISQSPSATDNTKDKEPARNEDAKPATAPDAMLPLAAEPKATEQQTKTTDTNTGTAEIKEPEAVQTPVTAEPIATPSLVAAAPAQTTAVAKADSAAIIPPEEPPVHKKIVMNFEAGLDYLAGWKNPGATDAKGFNPVIGFNYYNYLNDKLAVSLGAQYTSVSHLSYYTHVSKVTQYDLGVESDVTAITPQKIHYLAIPVKLNYFINENNSFGIGCNVAYMLTVDSKVETYHESFGRKTNDKSYKTSGYTDGFAAFDTQLSVFYRRKIYRNLSVSAEAVYGLTDIKTNGFFNSNVTERNLGLKLTLQYNLFK